MADKAEKELQRLRRLPENRICPNCTRKDTNLGFSAVCVPYRTFVCGDCKAAHQAFSHRCKSIGMSNWTMEEVKQLDESSGGGNRLAAERWTSRAPESVRPTPKSSLDAIKEFVDRAYNQKAWEVPVQIGDTDKSSHEQERRRTRSKSKRSSSKEKDRAKENFGAMTSRSTKIVSAVDHDTFENPSVAQGFAAPGSTFPGSTDFYSSGGYSSGGTPAETSSTQFCSSASWAALPASSPDAFRSVQAIPPEQPPLQPAGPSEASLRAGASAAVASPATRFSSLSAPGTSPSAIAGMPSMPAVHAAPSPQPAASPSVSDRLNKSGGTCAVSPSFPTPGTGFLVFDPIISAALASGAALHPGGRLGGQCFSAVGNA